MIDIDIGIDIYVSSPVNAVQGAIDQFACFLLTCYVEALMSASRLRLNDSIHSVGHFYLDIFPRTSPGQFLSPTK